MSELLHIANCDNANRKGDIVLLHGLDGDAQSTWRSSNGFYWPEHLGREFPEVGIWSVQYDASPSRWFGHAMPIFDRAVNILNLLLQHGIGTRPFMFVTHSLGGLLAKQIVITGQTHNMYKWSQCISRLRGIAFLATPHTGSAGGTWLDKLRFFAKGTELINELRQHSPFLRELNVTFRNISLPLGLRFCVYYETKMVRKWIVFGTLVVDPTSSDPGLPRVIPIAVDADHISICKPTGPDAMVYCGIKAFVKEALDSVRISEFNKIDTPPPSLELPLPGETDTISLQHIDHQTVDSSITDLGLDRDDASHPDTREAFGHFTHRLPIDNSNEVELEARSIVEKAKAAMREFAIDHAEQLVIHLKGLLDRYGDSWPDDLRDEIKLLVAELIKRRIDVARAEGEETDLSRLKAMIEELRSG